MNPVDWIAPLKEAVLLMYFLVFSGIVVWAFRTPDVQDHAQLPFLEEEVPVQ